MTMCKYRDMQTELWVHRERGAVSDLEGQGNLSGKSYYLHGRTQVIKISKLEATRCTLGTTSSCD